MKKPQKKKPAPKTPIERQRVASGAALALRRSVIKTEQRIALFDRLVGRMLRVRRDRELELANSIAMAHGYIVIPEHKLSDTQIRIGELQEENIELRRQLEEAQRVPSESVRRDVPQGEVVGV
jgi:hypothetical protein